MSDSLDNSDNLITIITGVIYISIHQSGYRHFINDLGRQKAPKTGKLFVAGTFRLSGNCLRRERRWWSHQRTEAAAGLQH